MPSSTRENAMGGFVERRRHVVTGARARGGRERSEPRRRRRGERSEDRRRSRGPQEPRGAKASSLIGSRRAHGSAPPCFHGQKLLESPPEGQPAGWAVPLQVSAEPCDGESRGFCGGG